MKGLCVPFVLAVCAFGCTTATYELNEDIGVQGEWTPEFAMPLGSVSMDLDGLEAWLDTEDFVQNEAGTEFVYVRSIPLFDVGADDLLTWGPESASIVHGFSSAEAAALNAAPDGNSVNVSFESTFDVGGGLGCSVEEAVFAGGSLVVSCVVEGPVGGSIGVTLPTLEPCRYPLPDVLGIWQAPFRLSFPSMPFQDPGTRFLEKPSRSA
jgi:hypothetical protein